MWSKVDLWSGRRTITYLLSGGPQQRAIATRAAFPETGGNWGNLPGLGSASLRPRSTQAHFSYGAEVSWPPCFWSTLHPGWPLAGHPSGA